MTKPTEQEKRDKKTNHKTVGNLWVGKKKIQVDIETETTPNQAGGYDTNVKIPRPFPVGAKNET